jgi:Xaa-Pro aminopeptidase
MNKISSTEYKERLNKLRQLCLKNECDALLIYNAEKEDPSFLPWILGAEIFDTTYLLITKEKETIFIPQWREENALAYCAATPFNIIGTPEKTTMTPTIKPHLDSVKSLGYAGNIPYKEIPHLGKINLVNIESSLRDLYKIKTPDEIKMLAQARTKTIDLLNSINWPKWIGHSEQELADWLQDKLKQDRLPLVHLCITSGPRTKKTSAGFPSNYIFQKDDIICIDFGLSLNTYISDITRCFFLGDYKNKYEASYENLQKIVQETAKQIKEGTQSKDIMEILKHAFSNQDMAKSFVPEDLGHGIGTGPHEYPEIGFDDQVIKKGTVFTLEPEALLPDKTLIRYEDMFFINSQGLCSLVK